MAKTIPGTFPARRLSVVRGGTIVDVPDTQDVVEGNNWLLAKRRLFHASVEFVDGDFGTSSFTYRAVEADAVKTLVAVAIVLPGEAKTTGGAGYRLIYLLEAQQTGATPGEVEILTLDTAGATLDSVTQAIPSGGTSNYYELSGARLTDSEVRAEVRLTSGDAAETIRLMSFAVAEEDLQLGDMP